jgi:hypothetical protein
MKLKDAIKKFNFLKSLDLTEKNLLCCANQLQNTIEGHTEVHITPLGKSCDPIGFLVDWDEIFDSNKHKMNSTLLDMERGHRSKFGPRSIAVPWAQRQAGLKASFNCQDEAHVPKFFDLPGEGDLQPAFLKEAAEEMKSSTSAGFPFFARKGKVKPELLANFDKYCDRKDPCALYTRTQESLKTRNVWGFPFADTLYEMMYFLPILWLQKKKYWRAAIVSPDCVAERVTELILKARSSSRIIYSVDFTAFDASVKFQYTIKAFEYFARCFAPAFGPLIEELGERFYTIAICTPSAVFRGKHGVPSGSTFTNEVDSVVQIGIALTNDFINEMECQIQGDDGVYLMPLERVSEFEKSFSYAGLSLNAKKSSCSSDYATYCQNLFHIDYLKDGLIGGIYPTYRAINRLIYQERFVDFRKAGVKGKDYYGIRALQILENVKYHPLFEDLVRFVLVREKYSLRVSDDGLIAYCNALQNNGKNTDLKHQYGTDASGIRNFEAYKIASRIIIEEGIVLADDDDEEENVDIEDPV